MAESSKEKDTAKSSPTQPKTEPSKAPSLPQEVAPSPTSPSSDTPKPQENVLANETRTTSRTNEGSELAEVEELNVVSKEKPSFTERLEASEAAGAEKVSERPKSAGDTPPGRALIAVIEDEQGRQTVYTVDTKPDLIALKNEENVTFYTVNELWRRDHLRTQRTLF